jgi:two-component system chemotaxis sensor kinase CheA
MDFREDTEIVNTFIAETMENLTAIEEGILSLEKNSEKIDGELVHSMFRAAHSIKAGANLLKVTNIESLSHELESILQRLRQQKLVLTRDIVDFFLKGIDQMQEMVNDLKHSYGIK